MRDDLRVHARRTWDVVIPVKGGPGAKSRLGAGPDLALAMAQDCVSAALGAARTGQVVVVTGDAETGAALGRLQGRGRRARVVRQGVDRPGLSAAIEAGSGVLGERCVVLLGDLPALRPGDLDAALEALTRPVDRDGAAFVPDAAGDGTVLLAARDRAHLVPRFGPASAAAHVGAGATPVVLVNPRLRADVDTPADLLAALDLGIGRHSHARVGSVQATVFSFDPDTRQGEVVLDDGTALPLDEAALLGSGLRHLRVGQRVTCAVGQGADRVIAVRINGIGDPLP